MRQPKNTVLFDLDKTLFDHYYSSKRAVAAIRKRFGLSAHDTNKLIDLYNEALQEAYDRYLGKEITYAEKDLEKVRLFFQKLNLPTPDEAKIHEFLELYETSYQEDRRATPGSVETLVRLKEHGYKLAIVTNGQAADQALKLEVIGIANLVDAVVTSEGIGHPKPSPEMFDAALVKLDASKDSAFMVGDSVKSDIVGALENGLDAVLYDPRSEKDEREINGVRVRVIHHIKELLSHLGIEGPNFAPEITVSDDVLQFSGMGADLVTAPRHCMALDKETIKICFSEMSQLCDDLSEGKPLIALARLRTIMLALAKDANLIDETQIRIECPGLANTTEELTATVPHEERKHSLAVSDFSGEIRLQAAAGWHPDAQEMERVLRLFQQFFDKLSIDHPRAGLRSLRDAFRLIGKQAGIDQENILIQGERIE
ncbi:MAG: HAD superfamily hydrolase (TIGR01549 family) [Oceanicoccus sp.]|jgi:HAD superfamily hydrolase (TIGR01549 family)